MKFLSLIKSTDFLGPEMKFRINNQENFKTVFGGFFSILYLIFLSYFFFYFGEDLFFKKNPKVITQNITPLVDYSTKNLSNENFIFAFRVTANESETLPIFLNKSNNMFMGYDKHTKEGRDIRLFAGFKACNESDFYFEINRNASEYICADIKDINITLGGGYETINDFFGNLYFMVGINQELFIDYADTTNKTQTEKYLKILQNIIFLEIITPQIFFDPKDHKKPLKYGAKYNFAALTFNTMVYDSFFFSDFRLETDEGYLFQNIEEQVKFGYNRKLSYSGYHNRTGFVSQYFADFNFDKSYQLASREYMKLQDLLGNVSGFMDLIMFCFSVLISLNSDFRIKKYIANKLVYIADDSLTDHSHEIKNKIKLFIKEDNVINKSKRELKVVKEANSINSKNFEMEKIKLNQNLNQDFKKPNIISEDKNNFNKHNNFSSNDNSSNSDRSILPISDIKIINNCDINNNSSNDNSLFKNEKTKKQIKFCYEIPESKDKRFLEYGFLEHFSNGKINCFNKLNYDKSISNYSIAEKIFNKSIEKFDILFYLKFINNFKLLEKLLLEENGLLLIDRLSEKEFFFKNNKKLEKLIEIDSHNKEIELSDLIKHFDKIQNSNLTNSILNIDYKQLSKILPDIE